MSKDAGRVKVRFASGGAECVAWHYLGTNGGCVIMAAGAGVTKEPGTDRFDTGFTTPCHRRHRQAMLQRDLAELDRLPQ